VVESHVEKASMWRPPDERLAAKGVPAHVTSGDRIRVRPSRKALGWYRIDNHVLVEHAGLGVQRRKEKGNQGQAGHDAGRVPRAQDE
jgi:hypothetical protein